MIPSDKNPVLSRRLAGGHGIMPAVHRLTAMLCMLLMGICDTGIVFDRMAHAGACQRIVVTSDPDYPPISWRDKENPDKIIGVAVEIIETAFAETGVQVEAKYTGPWKRALLSVVNGHVDMISGLYENQERQLEMEFVYPAFMADPVSVFVITGKEFNFEKWSDLQGRKGAVRAGDSFGNEFDRFARKYLILESVNEFGQLYKMASADRIAYFIYGYYSGLAFAEKKGVRDHIKTLERPIVREPLFVAFSRHSSCVAHKKFLSEKIRELVNAGLVDELIVKYQNIWKEQVKKTRGSPAAPGGLETIRRMD